MANGERHKIFAGSLPPDTTQEELMIVFGTYGNPVDIHLMGGKSTSGQCCAFVVYDSRDAAESAIASLDGVYAMREDGSAPIRVSWARPGPDRGSGAPRAPQTVAPAHHHHQPAMVKPQLQQTLLAAPAAPVHVPARVVAGHSVGAVAHHQQQLHASQGGHQAAPCAGGLGAGGVVPPPPPPDPTLMKQKTKLFVGNLPPDISQEAINIVFSHYGTVTNIHIMVGKAKSGQACAFVEYSAPIEAETAVLTLHEKYEIRPGDGAILVKYAAPGGGRAGPY